MSGRIKPATINISEIVVLRTGSCVALFSLVLFLEKISFLLCRIASFTILTILSLLAELGNLMAKRNKGALIRNRRRFSRYHKRSEDSFDSEMSNEIREVFDQMDIIYGELEGEPLTDR